MIILILALLVLSIVVVLLLLDKHGITTVKKQEHGTELIVHKDAKKSTILFKLVEVSRTVGDTSTVTPSPKRIVVDANNRITVDGKEVQFTIDTRTLLNGQGLRMNKSQTTRKGLIRHKSLSTDHVRSVYPTHFDVPEKAVNDIRRRIFSGVRDFDITEYARTLPSNMLCGVVKGDGSIDELQVNGSVVMATDDSDLRHLQDDGFLPKLFNYNSSLGGIPASHMEQSTFIADDYGPFDGHDVVTHRVEFVGHPVTYTNNRLIASAYTQSYLNEAHLISDMPSVVFDPVNIYVDNVDDLIDAVRKSFRSDSILIINVGHDDRMYEHLLGNEGTYRRLFSSQIYFDQFDTHRLDIETTPDWCETTYSGHTYRTMNGERGFALSSVKPSRIFTGRTP